MKHGFLGRFALCKPGARLTALCLLFLSATHGSALANGMWNWGGAIWALWNIIILLSGIIPLVGMIAALYSEKHRALLCVPMCLYVLVVNICAVSAMPQLWNPWYYLRDGTGVSSKDLTETFRLHFCASSMLLTLNLGWGIVVYKMAKQIRFLSWEARLTIATGIVVMLSFQYALGAQIIGFRYRTLYDGEPMRNPVKFVKYSERSMTLADGRVFHFEYRISGRQFAEDKLVEIYPYTNDAPGRVTYRVYAKVVNPYANGLKNPARFTIPLIEQKVPRFFRSQIGGEAWWETTPESTDH